MYICAAVKQPDDDLPPRADTQGTFDCPSDVFKHRRTRHLLCSDERPELTRSLKKSPVPCPFDAQWLLHWNVLWNVTRRRPYVLVGSHANVSRSVDVFSPDVLRTQMEGVVIPIEELRHSTATTSSGWTFSQSRQQAKRLLVGTIKALGHEPRNCRDRQEKHDKG